MSNSAAVDVSPPAAVEVAALEPAKSASKRVAAVPDSETDVDVDGRTRLSIRVLAVETAAPLAGIRILLTPDPVERGFSSRHVEGSAASFGESPSTDAEGRARIEVPHGRAFRLATSADGSAIDERVEVAALRQGEVRELELRLRTRPDLHFVARVVDDASGEPVANARGRIGHIRELLDDGGDPVAADAQGLIEVEALLVAGIALRVESPEHAWVGVSLAAGHETRATAREVRLKRAAGVQAQVVALAGFSGWGVTVSLAAKSYHLVDQGASSFSFITNASARWSAVTDADGRCHLSGLPPGVPLELSARAPGLREVRIPDPILLQPGETRAVEVPLGGGALLVGRLLDVHGAGVPEAQVRLAPRSEAFGLCLRRGRGDGGREVRTDALGRFEFREVPDGPWLVGCSPDGPFAPAAVEVVIADGRADREPELLGDAGLFLSGHVRGSDGRPLEAHVMAVGEQARCFVDGRTDAEGAFSLGPLVADTYTVSAQFAARNSERSWSPAAPVQAAAGASDVLLTLLPGASIGGRVVDPLTGLGVAAEVEVVVVDDSERRGSRTMARSKEDGSFRFEGLAQGTYSICASTPAVQLAIESGVRLLEGESTDNLTLALQPAARLRIRYDGPQRSVHLSVEWNGTHFRSDGIQSGIEQVLVVPPGDFVVECSEYQGEPGSAQTKAVSLAPGELATLEFAPSGG